MTYKIIYLTKKESSYLSDTSDLEKDIDNTIYKLYGLTDDEIAIIEGTNV